MKRKFINKAISIALSTAMIVGAVPTYPVFAANTGATSLDINVLATNIDITVPANVACTIDPNQVDPADRFMYGELKVTNNGTAPVDVSVTSFKDIDNTFDNNITPDGLPEGKAWETLNVSDTSKYFALGIKANDASNWNNLTLNEYVYVPEVTAPNLVGTLTSGGEGQMDLDASFGLNFKTVKDFSYELVFNAELSQNGATGGVSTPEQSGTYTIDEEETTPLNYELTPDGTASIDLNSLLGIDEVHAAPTEVNKDEFDNSKVVGTAMVTGLKDDSATELYIADYYQDSTGNYYKVKGIKEGSEDNPTIKSENLSKVVLNEGITEIPAFAFKGCVNMTDIEIPSTVTSIGKYAFSGCSSLEEVELPEGLKYIYGQAFSYCTNLKRVNSTNDGVCNIPDNVELLDSRCFFQNTSLDTFYVPESVSQINFAAFAGCNFGHTENRENKGYKSNGVYLEAQTVEDLPTFTLEENDGTHSSTESHNYKYFLNSPTSLNARFFVETTELANHLVDETDTTFPVFPEDSDVFYKFTVASNQQYVTLDKMDFKTIDVATEITNVEIPASYKGIPLTTIADNFKTNTTSSAVLEKAVITIPEGVTSVGKQAFLNTYVVKVPSTLTTVGTTPFQYADYVIYDGSLSTAAWAADNVIKSTSIDENFIYTDEDNTIIGKFIGSGKDIVVPDGIVQIKSEAFKGSAIETVSLPSTLTTLSTKAFYQCTNLNKVEIEEGLTILDTYVFYGCTNLTDVKLPDSLATISNYTFQNCTNLTEIELPSTMTSISNYAFSNCTNLNTIYYGGTLTSGTKWGATNATIDNSKCKDENFVYTSSSKTAITSYIGSDTIVNIPEGVTSIGKQAFTGKTTIEEVVIPNTVTSIGQSAFSGCTNLTTVNLPNSLTTIGGSAFNNTGLTSVTIPGSVKNISAFQNCKSLTNVVIEEGVESVGGFTSCSALQHISLPEGVTTIQSSAFESCGALQSITIPSTLTSVGKDAFLTYSSNFKTVNYRGSASQWSSISINSTGNTKFTSATKNVNYTGD